MKTSLVAGLLFLLATAPAWQQTPPTDKTARYEDERLTASEKEILTVARTMREELGDEVWPGFGKASIPILIYNDKYEFLVDYAGKPAGWEPVLDDVFDGKGYFRRGLTKASSFTSNIDGLWVATMSCLRRMNRSAPSAFLSIKEDHYAAMILHESFHAFQAQTWRARFDAALSSYTAGKSYLYGDQQFAEAWNKEGAALAAALEATTTESCADRVTAFLALRADRRRMPSFTEAMLSFEREIEWLEGLGKYTETKSYELGGKNARFSRGNRFQPNPYMYSEALNLRSRLGLMDGDIRFYTSGNAQARLLDRLMPGWKTRGLPNGIFLEDLLKQAVAAS